MPAIKVPDDMLQTATVAAALAAAGQKDAAYLSAIQTFIGLNPLRQFWRDGVKVYEGQITGPLPIVGSTIQVPTAVTQTFIATASITSGVWEHRVVNVDDPTKFIATDVTPPGGGGPVTLSGNLVEGGTVTFNTFTLNGPGLDATTVTLTSLGASAISQTSATLSVTIGGAIPTGAVMIFQYALDQLAGPWVSSATRPAVAGPTTWSPTGLLAGRTYYFRAFVYRDNGGPPNDVIFAQTPNATFTTTASTSTGNQATWLQQLYDSLAVRAINERTNIGGVNYVTAQDGSGIPFPDSYARVVSYDGIAAALAGRSTGTTPGDPLFFANGYNSAAIWGWFGAGAGHTATQSRIRVSNFGLAVLRKSTNQWVVAFRGMRGWGARYAYLGAPSDWGGGQDFSDPFATYIAPSGSETIELWPQRTPDSLPAYLDFFGVVDRALFADMASWAIVCCVRVEGVDRANARFVGTVGVDFYRDDHAGRRYWPGSNGLWQYVADGGGSEWQPIRNDGGDQWLVCPGVFELGRLKANPPPWGNYDGTWAYASGALGLTWAQFQANPPPDLRV